MQCVDAWIPDRSPTSTGLNRSCVQQHIECSNAIKLCNRMFIKLFWHLNEVSCFHSEVWKKCKTNLIGQSEAQWTWLLWNLCRDAADRLGGAEGGAFFLRQRRVWQESVRTTLLVFFQFLKSQLEAKNLWKVRTHSLKKLRTKPHPTLTQLLLPICRSSGKVFKTKMVRTGEDFLKRNSNSIRFLRLCTWRKWHTYHEPYCVFVLS